MPSTDHIEPKERELYSRHLLLRELNLDGVKKIKQGRVAIIGVGGLAAPLLTYLTASGIGHITLIDHDRVALSNLARQFIFHEEDVGKLKSVAAAEKLQSLNPRIELNPITEKVTKNNFVRCTDGCDLVVETVDTTTAKISIHDLCLHYQKPLVHGAALAWEGQLLTILPGQSPCLRCFFPHLSSRSNQRPTNSDIRFDAGFTNTHLPWEEESDSCSIEGVLSPLCGVIGSYQATEVLRFFTHPFHDLHIGKMLRVNLARNQCYYLHPQNRTCSCGWKSNG